MAKLAPSGYQAPYPAHEAVVPQGAVVTLALVGVQYRDDDQGAGRDAGARLRALLAGDGGSGRVEVATHVDADGYRNDVHVTYWRDPGHLAGATPELDAWAAAHRTGPVGVWRETVVAPRGRMETSYSVPGVRWGLGATGATTGQPYHAYYGSMRDRIDAAEDGGLPPAVPPITRRAVDSRGRVLRATLPPDLCFIRTVQGWQDAGEAELAELHAHVLPAYRRGVAHLVAHPEETNCLSARLVEDIAVDGGPRPQVDSETFAWFRSLADLEAWTHHHPTHEDIFSRFGAMAAALDFKVGTLLGHEVYVVPAGAAEAVYVNCHPATGLLPFVDTV